MRIKVNTTLKASYNESNPLMNDMENLKSPNYKI